MKIEITYTLRLSEDSGEIIFIEPQKTFAIGKQSLTEYSNDLIKVPAGSDDLEYNLGLVNNANVLFILTDQSISFKKNTNTGEAAPIVADKISGDKLYGIHLSTTSGVTSLYFSNTGDQTANVKIIIAS